LKLFFDLWSFIYPSFVLSFSLVLKLILELLLVWQSYCSNIFPFLFSLFAFILEIFLVFLLLSFFWVIHFLPKKWIRYSG
jgi:hypothetical protein